MPEEFSVGCARPAGGSVSENKTLTSENEKEIKKEEKNMIMIGRKAPDFVAPAYYNRKFAQVRLSEYIGKWTLLCFYPGDFTFV
jgi:peroxiredoxin (alkyl hydroperoxide reductase subunit C)